MRPSLVLFCVLTLSACGTASSSAPMSGPVLGEVVVVQGDRSAEVAYERPLIGADRGRAQADMSRPLPLRANLFDGVISVSGS